MADIESLCHESSKRRAVYLLAFMWLVHVVGIFSIAVGQVDVAGVVS